jgi:hypothetical protein
MLVLKIPAVSNMIDSITKPYTAPQFANNTFLFFADKVGIMPAGKTPTGCTAITNGFQCPANTELEIYVNVKSTGNKALPVYARPRVGFECNDAGKCNNEAWLDGSVRCQLPIGGSVDCDVGYTFKFTESKAEYRIYPAAKALQADIAQLVSDPVLADEYSYNSNNVLFIKTT